MHRNLPKTVVASALLTLMVTAACADTGDAATTSAPAAAEDHLRRGRPAGQTASGTVAVTAVNYAFAGVPATVAAGSRLTLTNDADDEATRRGASQLGAHG